MLAANATGARIWQLIEHQRTPGEIARQLAAEYGISEERAAADVAAFVAALAARGLVSCEVRA